MKWSMILFSIFLTGCTATINRTLSPPSDTKWVYVDVKNPTPFTQPFPLEVRYISKECLKRRISGFDGSIITEPSYNVIRVPLQQRAGNLSKAQVAMNGGGSCKWTLSAISLGIKYINVTHFEKDLVPGTATGATVAFDRDASRNGQYDNIMGNYLDYSPVYYPLIVRWADQKNSSQKSKLYLFGKKTPFWSVRLHVNGDADAFISYQPAVNERKKVEMFFPYEKFDGATYTYVYPNGERISSKEIRPDFKKLDDMK